MKDTPVTTRIESLDTLRAVAVLLVVLYHFRELVKITFPSLFYLDFVIGHGWIGVDLFYVLSGFFIGNAVLRPTVWQPLTFIKRRIRRIIPGYYGSMLLIIAFSNTVFIASSNGLIHIASHLLLIHNFFPAHAGTINGAYWTLSVEWFFYILMLITAPLLRSRRWFFPTMGVFLIITYGWRMATIYWWPTTEWMRLFVATQLPGSLDEFVVGILVARWMHWQDQRGTVTSTSRTALLLGVIGLLGFVGVMNILMQSKGNFYKLPLMIIFWRSLLSIDFGSLIMAFLLIGRKGTRLLHATGSTYIGRISYSIYLYHIPVILAFKACRPDGDLISNDLGFLTLALITIIALASVSYYCIEKPWL